MTTAATTTGTAERFLAALLPADWRDRAPLLDAAARLDRERGDGLAALLASWRAWRCSGALATTAPARDLVAALAHVLGGVGVEMRSRPRAVDGAA